MKLIYFIFVLIFAIAVRIDPAVSEDQNPRIGVITFLSGPNATIGTAIKNGIELARHQRPELLQAIDFQYEDDQCDPKLDISAYRKLTNGRGIDILFGIGPAMVNVLWPDVERDKVPFINFNFEASSVVGKPLVVRAMNHTGQYQQALASYLINREKSPDYPVIVGEHPFLQAMSRSLTDALGRQYPVREVATVLPTETDFRPLILKIRSYRDKPVGLFLFPESLIAFLKQARWLGFSASYFGTDLCESAAKLAGDPSLLEGCLYADNEASEAFRSDYRGKYGNEAQLAFAGNAYDMTVLMGEVLQQGRSIKGPGVIDALRKVSRRKGVLGDFSFTSTESTGSFFEYPIHVKRIENGRGVVVD
jgi:ABC-type branched-subunit amino acid transport system substrate-binding protein